MKGKISLIIAVIYILSAIFWSCQKDDQVSNENLTLKNAVSTKDCSEFVREWKDSKETFSCWAKYNGHSTVIDTYLDVWNDESKVYFTVYRIGETFNEVWVDGVLIDSGNTDTFSWQYDITNEWHACDEIRIYVELRGMSGGIGRTNNQLFTYKLRERFFDGIYEVTALSPMLDVLNPNITGNYPFNYWLIPLGRNTVICYYKTLFGPDNIYFEPTHPILFGGNSSVYGAFGLIIEFNPITGDIISVKNPWGNPPSNTRNPVIDPSGVNRYDKKTKTIRFNYWMIQPSLIPLTPYIRTYFNEVWTFKKQID